MFFQPPGTCEADFLPSSTMGSGTVGFGVQVVLLPAFEGCGRLIGYNVTAACARNGNFNCSIVFQLWRPRGHDVFTLINSAMNSYNFPVLFQQEFLRSPGPVNHRCVLLVDGMLAPPGVLHHRRLVQRLGLACIPVFPLPGFQPPLGLANVGLATAAGNSVYHIGLLLHRQSILHLGQQ